MSPPRSSCLICEERFWTSERETGARVGRRDVRGKLEGESGSRRSIFMVRQFAVAIVLNRVREGEGE